MKYNWFPITAKQIKNIKVGDKLRYYIQDSKGTILFHSPIEIDVNKIILNNWINFSKDLIDIEIYRKLNLKEFIIYKLNIVFCKIKDNKKVSKILNKIEKYVDGGITYKCFELLPYINIDWGNYKIEIDLGWLWFYIHIRLNIYRDNVNYKFKK
jgi:hypothetical protein